MCSVFALISSSGIFPGYMDIVDKAISFNKDYVFLSEVMTYEINKKICRNNFRLRKNMNIDYCFIHGYTKFGYEIWKVRNSSTKC
jgi:hypothetical protein